MRRKMLPAWGHFTKRTVKHANAETCRAGLREGRRAPVDQWVIGPDLTRFGPLPDVSLKCTPTRRPRLRLPPLAPSSRDFSGLRVLHGPFREVTPTATDRPAARSGVRRHQVSPAMPGQPEI